MLPVCTWAIYLLRGEATASGGPPAAPAAAFAAFDRLLAALAARDRPMLDARMLALRVA